MTRESHIEKRVCAAAAANGWLVHPKAAHGTRGWPDRTFTKVESELTLQPHAMLPYPTVVHGVFLQLVFVEFKAPGKKPTPLQTHTHTKLRKLGYEVHVIDSIEDGTRLFAG